MKKFHSIFLFYFFFHFKKTGTATLSLHVPKHKKNEKPQRVVLDKIPADLLRNKLFQIFDERPQRTLTELENLLQQPTVFTLFFERLNNH